MGLSPFSFRGTVSVSSRVGNALTERLESILVHHRVLCQLLRVPGKRLIRVRKVQLNANAAHVGHELPGYVC